MKRLRVLILGYGEMGHALEHLLADHHDITLWDKDVANSISAEQHAKHAQVVLFCLPVNPHFEIASRLKPHLTADTLCLSIAKGLDESGRTAAQVFEQVLGGHCHYGVLYGPMISEEIRADRYGFADTVLSDTADYDVILNLFLGSKLICQQASDMHGHSWSVILKNVYAILFGVADELRLGKNVRGHLMVAAMTELSGIVQALGGHAHTPYGYAGLGDLMTTGTSADSHHHELGCKLARGEWDDISGEGIHTLRMVIQHRLFDWQAFPLFALTHAIVNKPQALHEHIQQYLEQLNDTQRCAI